MKILSVRFANTVELEHYDSLKWKVLVPFAVDIYLCQSVPIRINVPAGFVTDLASVPRVFWSLIPPEGKVDEPSVVHDYLYAKGGDLRIGKFSRADADRFFFWVACPAGCPTRVRTQSMPECESEGFCTGGSSTKDLRIFRRAVSASLRPASCLARS